ncbi:MAG: hypothetical protein AABY32_05105 [Nanoarchaeota archaeon]
MNRCKICGRKLKGTNIVGPICAKKHGIVLEKKYKKSSKYNKSNEVDCSIK